MANNNNGEPSSAPQPERWYELKLGSSFKDHSPSKFCTLRYEFKPASIDKSQPGSLHKNKENRVTVEFHNNQPGKPKVSFEGSSEDYKDNDAVLFFDGETFRLERLHRAVKRLRHVRLPGESAASAANMASAASAAATNIASAASAAATNIASAASESHSPQLGKISKTQPLNKPIVPSIHVEVERIDIGEPDSPGTKLTNRSMDYKSAPQNTFSISPEPKLDEQEENINIDVDEDEEEAPPKMAIGGQPAAPYVELDINLPTQNDTDDEIADVDVSDDEAGKGPNAAEALRAQVNAEEEGQQQQQEDDEESSSSSGSSGSGSSGSGSGSGSSSSDSSDDDSASSGGDIDI